MRMLACGARSNSARGGRWIEIQQRSDPEAYLEELGEAEQGGGRRRAHGSAVAFGLLLRHRVEHLSVHTDPTKQINREKTHHTTPMPVPQTKPKPKRISRGKERKGDGTRQGGG